MKDTTVAEAILVAAAATASNAPDQQRAITAWLELVRHRDEQLFNQVIQKMNKEIPHGRQDSD